MWRTLGLFILFIAFCSADVNQQADEKNLFDLNFYDRLTHDIEYFDAEAIDTRNRTKSVSWEDYKKHYRDQLKKCITAECAQKTFLRFADGFVNLHSRFEITGYTDPRVTTDSVYRAQPALVFDYPSVRCYESSGMREITHLNGISIRETVNQFSNYECPYSSEAGCATLFFRKLNANWLTLDGRPLESITYSDGRVLPVKFARIKRPQRDAKKEWIAYFNDWRVVAEGNKFVLLRKNKTFLLKYVDFLYDGGLGEDMACESPAPQGSLCYDVQLLTKSIRDNGPVENLVIDLQNNGGGVEITPLLKALVKQPFYDANVRFRKTPALENDSVRPYLFWSSSRLENWFSRIRKQASYQTLPYGAFLPSCADFCRGSDSCELTPIQPTGKLAIGKILLVTNPNCVSSCDDFVWRMKDYAGAQVAGQPHASDATFSRITLSYYYQNGQVFRKESGPGQPVPTQNLFFTATIPNSAILDRSGKPIQGVPVILDLQVPIVKEHFADMELYTLSEVLKKYKLDQE